MSDQICFQCFQMKGEQEVCPWCGYTPESTANQAYQLRPGTVLDHRYIIGITLGIGGFGITYKAFDISLSIVVAIKEFYPARLVNRAEGEVRVGVFSGEKREEYNRCLKRFEEEAQMMAEFSNEPDIVKIYSYLKANETAYIIMEYVDAELLKDRLGRAPKMSVEEASGYLISILTALAKIHQKGIVHKDISPDNIFLTGKDTIKLGDFGAARRQEEQPDEHAEVIVKVGYTPPEQYQPGSGQKPSMDVYSAGAVFYEMVTGEKPLDAMDRQDEDLLQSPARCGAVIDARLDRIVMRAMAVKPRFRFQAAEQFRCAVVGKEKVRLPEEELKQKRRLRLAAGIGAGMISLVLAVVLVLSQTVFSSRGKLDVEQIKAETITLWLPVEGPEDGTAQALQECVQAQYPQLTLLVEEIPQEDYEVRIRTAMEEGRLPEAFCTDGFSLEEKKEYCQSLAPLFRTMDLSAFLFAAEWETHSLYALPTAIQPGVVYVNTEKSKQIPVSCQWQELGSDLDQTVYAEEENACALFAEGDSEITQLVGDLELLADVKAVTVDRIPPTDFAVIPVLDGDKLAACYTKCFAVNQAAEQGKQEAAMVVLAAMLEPTVQSEQYMDNEEGIPINREIYQQYQEVKMTTYLAFLKEYGEGRISLKEEEEMGRILRTIEK